MFNIISPRAYIQGPPDWIAPELQYTVFDIFSATWVFFFFCWLIHQAERIPSSKTAQLPAELPEGSSLANQQGEYQQSTACRRLQRILWCLLFSEILRRFFHVETENGHFQHFTWQILSEAVMCTPSTLARSRTRSWHGIAEVHTLYENVLRWRHSNKPAFFRGPRGEKDWNLVWLP